MAGAHRCCLSAHREGGRVLLREGNGSGARVPILWLTSKRARGPAQVSMAVDGNGSGELG